VHDRGDGFWGQPDDRDVWFGFEDPFGGAKTTPIRAGAIWIGITLGIVGVVLVAIAINWITWAGFLSLTPQVPDVEFQKIDEQRAARDTGSLVVMTDQPTIIERTVMANQRLLRLSGVVVLLALRGSTTTLIRIEAQAPSGLMPSMKNCQLSELVWAEPPRDPNADPFGRGPWYVNADRSIWAGWLAGHWVSGSDGNKVLWIRPRGTNLEVAGRRLDGDDAVELRVDIPCCYPTGFQASRVYFPASGCWEVTATAGDSELRFVTNIP